MFFAYVGEEAFKCRCEFSVKKVCSAADVVRPDGESDRSFGVTLAESEEVYFDQVEGGLYRVLAAFGFVDFFCHYFVLVVGVHLTFYDEVGAVGGLTTAVHEVLHFGAMFAYDLASRLHTNFNITFADRLCVNYHNTFFVRFCS